MEVPGEPATAGQFDLRGGVHDYLGRIEFRGRRVLEIGPANGFLTFHMESRGANVVAVELGPDAEWDIVPHAGLDLATIRAERRAIMERLRNGFWWGHARLQSAAKVHYGDVYALPDELGRFDVAIMAAVLRHTRDPLRIVESCAARAEQLVITEMRVPDLEGMSVMRLVPSGESPDWDTWWDFTPELLGRFLEVLGFEQIVATHHEQTLLVDGAQHAIPFFTLVASRS